MEPLQNNRKIRILECIRQGQIGGGESHLLSLVENLDKEKFDPVVLSFTNGPMIDALTEMKVSNHVIHTEKPFDFSKWKQVKQFIRQQDIDLVHAHGTRANSNILWAARSLGIPVVYTVHGWSFHPDQSTLVKKIRVLGEKYLTSRTQLNISVSASNQQSGKDHIRTFDSIVINNGINQKKFNPERTFKNIRAELNLPQDKVLVVFIARFTAHKQPLALIEAFNMALKDNPDMHLLMVGDGDQKTEALDLIRKMDLSDHVTFQPFRKDVPDVLAAADIFVLPSLWEGLPIGLLEAMAMGKAIIASKVDGTSEIIQDNENGVLIETDNLVKNLSNALVHLSADAEKRKYFSRNARDTVRKKYNAEEMTRQIEKIYIDLVQKKPVHGRN